MNRLMRPALLTILGTLILTSCGVSTPAPATLNAAADPALSAQRLPDEPICPITDDPYLNPDCDTGGGPTTTYYSYWTLAQVARIDARAAYMVGVALGSRDNYAQEYNAHYPGQRNLVNIFWQSPTPANAQNISTLVTPYPGLNWSEDGCSAPWFAHVFTLGTATLYSNTFKSACRLHDFGYRNIGRLANEVQVSSGQTQTVNQEALRREVDDQFRANMMQICEGKDWIMRGACKGAAKAFASAVRGSGQQYWNIWNFEWVE